MIIPTNPNEREGFYWDLVERCLASRQQRKDDYSRWRSYFLFGSSPDSDPATYNKIYPSIDTLTSFLFAADTTRFVIKLGAEAPKEEMTKIPSLIQRLNDKWQDSNADNCFGQGVSWSLTYGTEIVKLVQRGDKTHPFLIDPHNFGVLREDVPMLSRQEAFVQVFMTTRSQLERDLSSHPRRGEILSRVSGAARQVQDTLPAGVQRMIISNIYPLSNGMNGAVTDVLNNGNMYKPMSQEELIEMYELWVWNDDAHDGVGDWQVVTLADPSICVYDRPSGDDMFIAGDHPFTAITPNPAHDYFWGYSDVDRLTKLQDLREHHLMQAGRLVDLAVNSPKALQGQWASPDEKAFAMSRIGALLSSNDPQAKVTEFKHEVPSDLWSVVNKIDEMFDEAISLNNLSKGHGDTGVRSKGQTESLLRVGSSRPKKRALVIEDALERIATLYMKLDQQHNPDALTDSKGMEFIADQFTKDYMVKVDAHSSSPVFVEDMKNLAFDLFKMHIIDGEAVLDMTQPQNVQVLKERYKEMQKAQAEAKAKEEALHEKEIEGKVHKQG